MKVATLGVVFGLVAALLIGGVKARDLGQWENSDPAVVEWFRNLKQPDSGVSCCGDADSYWCDEVHYRDGKTFCNITDDRDDEKLRRTPVAIGTEIEIPNEKLNRDPNPTGHSIVFLSSGGFVYCFVGNGGV